MTPPVYRFNVGAFACVVLTDGITPLDAGIAGGLFAHAPQEQLAAALQAQGIRLDALENHLNCLLVDSGTQRVLIETGMGSDAGPLMGQLPTHLHTAGYAPADIDVVFVSHGHPDHIGGNARDGQPAFPNARYMMGQQEWDFWTAEATLANLDAGMAGFMRANLLAIRERFDLIANDAQILPGLRALPTPGHSPGHLALVIESEGEELVYTADAASHPLHFQYPEWSSSFDSDPSQAAQTRRMLREYLTARPVRLLSYHYPFPGVGRLVRANGSYQWRASENPA